MKTYRIVCSKYNIILSETNTCSTLSHTTTNMCRVYTEAGKGDMCFCFKTPDTGGKKSWYECLQMKKFSIRNMNFKMTVAVLF